MDEKNALMHLQGIYLLDALKATVENALKPKGAKQYEYPSKPYPLTESKRLQSEEEEKNKQVELLFAQLGAMKTNFDLEQKRKSGTVS